MASDLSLASWPQDQDLEWCPPGHGDLYAALMTSGVLEQILAENFQVLPNHERSTGDIRIDLDPAFYRLIDDLENRFPQGTGSAW